MGKKKGNVFRGVLLFLGLLLLLASINAEIRYQERLKFEETHGRTDTPIVSSAFNGTTYRVGEWMLFRGNISFLLSNLPEEEGAVKRVVLYKYQEGEEVSCRTIYAPWHNIVYALRNPAGGVTCRPTVLGAVRQESEIEYWIDVMMSDGTVYRTYAVQLDAKENEIGVNNNIYTEVYNSQGEFWEILSD